MSPRVVANEQSNFNSFKPQVKEEEEMDGLGKSAEVSPIFIIKEDPNMTN